MDCREACWRRSARSSGDGFEGERNFVGEGCFGGDEIGWRWAFGLEMVGVVSVEGVWCSGDDWGSLVVALRGVLKGDLKGLERAEEESRRRRLRGGGGDIGALWRAMLG